MSRCFKVFGKPLCKFTVVRCRCTSLIIGNIASVIIPLRFEKPVHKVSVELAHKVVCQQCVAYLGLLLGMIEILFRRELHDRIAFCLRQSLIQSLDVFFSLRVPSCRLAPVSHESRETRQFRMSLLCLNHAVHFAFELIQIRRVVEQPDDCGSAITIIGRRAVNQLLENAASFFNVLDPVSEKRESKCVSEVGRMFCVLVDCLPQNTFRICKLTRFAAVGLDEKLRGVVGHCVDCQHIS